MARDALPEEIKLRVTAETKKALKEIADSRPPGEGDSESAVVREAIREYLSRRGPGGDLAADLGRKVSEKDSAIPVRRK